MKKPRKTTAWAVEEYSNYHPKAGHSYFISVPATVTAKQARLENRYRAFDLDLIIPLDRLDETREAALERWHKSVQERLDEARAEVLRLEGLLLISPENPA